jgi:hypothetical protein
LVGEVDDVLDPRAFVLEDHGLLWAPEIPVVARAPIAFAGKPIADGDNVQVIGMVYARITPELARELRTTLAPDRAAAIGDGPVVIARSVRRSEP